MDIEQLLQDHGVHYQTEGHKHCRPGWTNLPCPYCTGNPGLHLGIAIDGSRAYCWRCGWKPIHKALSHVMHLSEQDVKSILRKYKGLKPVRRQQKVKIRRKSHKMPSGISGLLAPHRKYLRNRRFDPDYLERHWGLVATGPTSYLDKIDYRHRILIPIYWEREQVSFQARDITGKSDIKYKACPTDREVIHHKNVLYHHQDIDWAEPVVVVEGVTDAWRLGKQTIATFGIEFTHRQALELIKKKKASKDGRVVILFDDDPQAQIQARKLQIALEESGLNCQIEIIQGDPADMDQETANQFMEGLCLS